MKKLLALVALVAVVAVPALGCAVSAPAEETGNEAPVLEGATARIVVADEKAGKLVIAVTRAGHEIRFDLRLGEKMGAQLGPSAEALAADPELTSHQIDAGLTDASGQPFHMQMGGDSFLDSTWRNPVVENVNPALRAKDYQLARDARSALRSLVVPAALEELRRGALQVSLGLETIEEKPASSAEPITVPAEQTDPALGIKADSVYNSSAYYWDYYVAKKDIAGGIGDHSAVTARAWSSGKGLLASYGSCNHGTCSTSMTRHCTMSGYRSDNGTHRRNFYSEPSTSTGTISGGCRSSYSWYSGTSSHNCNDDSQIQGEAVYYNSSPDRYNGHCGSFGGRSQAPNPPGC